MHFCHVGGVLYVWSDLRYSTFVAVCVCVAPRDLPSGHDKDSTAGAGLTERWPLPAVQISRNDTRSHAHCQRRGSESSLWRVRCV